MSSWDRFNPQLHLKNTLVEINAASQPGCLRSPVQSGVSCRASQPAYFKHILPGQEIRLFHIECSGISTGNWRDLNCYWSLKEVLIHVGQNLAPPFQSELHLERKTQHNAQLLDPDACCVSGWDTGPFYLLFPCPLPHTLVEEHKAL